MGTKISISNTLMYLSALSRKPPTRAMVIFRKPPTRAMVVYMVSSVAKNVRTPSTVVTHGPTWEIACRVTLWRTPTPNQHHEDQTRVRTNAYIYVYIHGRDISLTQSYINLKVVNYQFLASYPGPLPKSYRDTWQYYAESPFLILGRQITFVHYYVQPLNKAATLVSQDLPLVAAWQGLSTLCFPHWFNSMCIPTYHMLSNQVTYIVVM